MILNTPLRRVAMMASILSAILSGPAFAATPEETQVNNAVESFRSAMVRGDGEALTELASPDLSFGHSNGMIQTREIFVGTVVDRKEIFRSVKLTEPSTKVVGDLAIRRHIFNADILIDGKPLVVSLGCLEIWQRQDDGRWLLTARQAFNTNAPMPKSDDLANIAKNAAPVAAAAALRGAIGRAARTTHKASPYEATPKKTVSRRVTKPRSKVSAARIHARTVARRSKKSRVVRRTHRSNPVQAAYPSAPPMVFPGDAPTSRQARY